MTKSEIASRLHAMVREHLFVGSWPLDAEANGALHKQLLARGLIKENDIGYSATALGNELDLDLLCAFLGHSEISEIPSILVHYGLMEPDQELEIVLGFEKLGDAWLEAKVLSTLVPIHNERFGAAAR